MTGSGPPGAAGEQGPRRWRWALLAVVMLGVAAALATAGRPVLTESVATFAHLRWGWLPLAIIAEAGSMAAFARVQRRLLRAGGRDLHLGSVMAVTYAGNAIAASLPLAGSELAASFSFKQFNRRGIDPAVTGWALAVSGIFSAFAFAVVLGGGAIASGSTTAALAGVGGALLSVLPMLAVVAALRYRSVRHALNRLLGGLLGLARRLFKHPRRDAAASLERFLDKVASLRLARLQYAEIFALSLWNWAADCLCLACAIRATGAHIPWQGLFLAYGAGMTAATICLTPGSLGIIEAALTTALIAAGLSSHHALAAVLVYRFISFWLVMSTGWAVMAVISRAAKEGKSPATA